MKSHVRGILYIKQMTIVINTSYGVMFVRLAVVNIPVDDNV